MTRNTTFRISRLGLASLAILLTGAAYGQVKDTGYAVTILGPANSNHLPSLGLDASGRVAGTTSYDEFGTRINRAFLFDMVQGYRLSPMETSTINAVSANGHLAGSSYGSPTLFDWTGNPLVVFTANAGRFMGVNSHRDAVGYVYDPMNNWLETAVVFDRDGNLLQIPTQGIGASAAYGINDAGMVVGYANDAFGETRAFLWNGQMTYLPGLPGNSDVAVAVNNRFEAVGYTVTPTDGLVPVKWNLGPNRAIQVRIELPDGMDYGYAKAVNDNGQIVGSMWAANDDFGTAFVTRRDGTVINLNELKDATNRVYNLVTADAINANGTIVGTAVTKIHVNGPAVTMAYIARPLRTTDGMRVR